MNYESVIQKFGFPATLESRDELRTLLAEEIARERRGESGEEMLRILCLQLFSLGLVDDSLLIWDAKQSSFDAFCGLDVQFLCGAGLGETKRFLAASSAPTASIALKYIEECESAGDFEAWTPKSSIADYRNYYGIS